MRRIAQTAKDAKIAKGMPLSIQVIGVHPVTAGEAVHLIEIELSDPDAFDFGVLTQSIQGEPPENWQVAHDERIIEGNNGKRFAFFFHYLDMTKPLFTPEGDVALPPISERPDYLKHIEYEQP